MNMTIEDAINAVHSSTSMNDLRALYIRLMNEFRGDDVAIWAIQEAVCAVKEGL